MKSNLNFLSIQPIFFRADRIPVAMKYGLTIQMYWQVISMKFPFVECQMSDRSKSHVEKLIDSGNLHRQHPIKT